MVRDSPGGIVRKTEPLSEQFLPEGFPGREGILQELLDCLRPAVEKQPPLHSWLHGPPGSGKTSAAKRVLAQLEEQGIRTAYVNCWSSQTFYGVLDTIFQELRALVGEQRDVAFKFERLGRLARERPLVLVLDEVDQMFLKERNATLYNLSRLDHAGLVCLSQTREAYLSLDSRVRSRLQPRFLEFRAYPAELLVSILQERAGEALSPEAWCQADLEKIAGAAGGDARIAIQTLRTAAYLAEKGRIPQIRLADIEEGLRKSSKLRRNYLLRNLSEHHRLMYRLVKDSPGILTGELWKRYRGQAKERGLRPRKRRTFNHYKQYLVTNGLLTERQLKGRANQRALWVGDDGKGETTDESEKSE